MSERTPQQAYLGLQKLARSQGRNTQQLFELYIHERFLARLAASRFAERFVLKGGMLLAVLDVRRATRDADMLALGLASDEDNLRTVVGEILAIPMGDGVSFDPAGISITSIREDADYDGIRLTLPVARFASSRGRCSVPALGLPACPSTSPMSSTASWSSSMRTERERVALASGSASLGVATRCKRRLLRRLRPLRLGPLEWIPFRRQSNQGQIMVSVKRDPLQLSCSYPSASARVSSSTWGASCAWALHTHA